MLDYSEKLRRNPRDDSIHLCSIHSQYISVAGAVHVVRVAGAIVLELLLIYTFVVALRTRRTVTLKHLKESLTPLRSTAAWGL